MHRQIFLLIHRRVEVLVRFSKLLKRRKIQTPLSINFNYFCVPMKNTKTIMKLSEHNVHRWTEEEPCFEDSLNWGEELAVSLEDWMKKSSVWKRYFQKQHRSIRLMLCDYLWTKLLKQKEKSFLHVKRPRRTYISPSAILLFMLVLIES